jgi:hypothetical protein
MLLMPKQRRKLADWLASSPAGGAGGAHKLVVVGLVLLGVANARAVVPPVQVVGHQWRLCSGGCRGLMT